MTDALSLDEANRLRIALGLQPLPAPGSAQVQTKQHPGHQVSEPPSSSSRDGLDSHEGRIAASADNWHQLRVSREAEARRQEHKEQIKKAKDRATRFSILQGAGLGDLDGSQSQELSTQQWLRQQRKAKKGDDSNSQAQSFAQRGPGKAAEVYESKHLKGLKIGHGLADFDEAGSDERILTLRDAMLDELDGLGDVLEDRELAEEERVDLKLERTKRKSTHDAHSNLTPPGILSHYDDEDSRDQNKSLTIETNGNISVRDPTTRFLRQEQKLDDGRIAVNLQQQKQATLSDYQDTPHVRSRKRRKRFKAIEADMDGEGVRPSPNDQPAILPSNRTYDPTEQLDPTATIAYSNPRSLRSWQANESTILRPEDLALRIAQGDRVGADLPRIEHAATGDLIVVDETAEFLSGLRRPENRGDSDLPAAGTVERHRPAQNRVSDDGRRAVEPQTMKFEATTTQRLRDRSESENDVGIGQEATVDSVAGTLDLLKARQMISKPASADMNAKDRAYAQLLAEKARLAQQSEARARAERERDRQSNRQSAMSNRDAQSFAQHENLNRGLAESRILAEVFDREYRPIVELKYIDEDGRSIGQKEAFKQLSHQFHGKKSGKGKTEKRLKRIAAEKEREARGTLDVSDAVRESGGGGMIGAQGGQARKMGTAGVRLQ